MHYTHFLSVCFSLSLCRDCDDIFNGDLYEYRNQCRTCSGSNVVSDADGRLREPSGNVVRVASCKVITMFALQPDYFPQKQPWWSKLRAFFKSEQRVLSQSHKVNAMKEGYHCPKCRANSLRFELDAMVD